jgi:hypothetical protein
MQEIPAEIEVSPEANPAPAPEPSTNPRTLRAQLVAFRLPPCQVELPSFALWAEAQGFDRATLTGPQLDGLLELFLAKFLAEAFR